MNLATTYLRMELRSPLVVGASPFCDDLQMAHRLQDAGAGAVVMRSLFEEQIEAEQRALLQHTEGTADAHSEARSYFPGFAEYQLSPDRYLEQIRQLKKTLTIPVIGSLNGCRPGGWTDYASLIEQAGADALELNLYQLATDPEADADQIEADMLETVTRVVQAVRIPVAVKLSPFHTSPAQFSVALERCGAAGVVLFNRLYQPDFNIDELEVQPILTLSEPSELLLRLRWLAIISPHLKGSLAATGGVHRTEDALKAILAGAHTVQLTSVLLRHGPRFLTTLLDGIRAWMEERGYANLEELRGAMNHKRCPNPAAFERANYQRILQSWRV
jgi:dihydroorotate dehydrogenase (fumarate)